MLVAVAVPVPFLGELTYAVPEGMAVPAIGARVRVPVGTRLLTGCVVSHTPSASEITPKAIQRILDDQPLVPSAVVTLCRWTADYYLCGIGDALRMAMPPGARHERPSFKTRRVATITFDGRAAVLAQDAVRQPGESPTPRLTARQRHALAGLAAAPAGMPLADLASREISSDVVTRLAAKGLVEIQDQRMDRDPWTMDGSLPEPAIADQLTAEQQAAVQAIEQQIRNGRFAVTMLHGVTGSGKTEIYLRLASVVVASGRQVLVMVPEIALTPSVAGRFRRAFGARVAIQHSALGDGERHDQWHRIRQGDVDIVVGTRSAVFAPLERLGLIVVDEEHDASYKQEETPRYHGRDVAIVRAQMAGAVVVLGSATPSLESYHNASTGKYALVALEKRVLDRPLPRVQLVNMRDEYAERGPDVVTSLALEEAIERRLAAREQVMVLLNRRGYATTVFCRQCGETFECPNCSVSLTVHLARGHGRVEPSAPAIKGWARCHYCNHAVRIPPACRTCAAPYLELTGFGTERVEAHLAERFPGARIGRVDRDSVRRKGALHERLAGFAAGALDILVGTQMIAKGHDFPGVTLVGVISADVGLGLADFRAAERTFQLLTQVAGRAGRGERVGEAIVQTLYPDHYSVRLACQQDYRAFFAQEIDYRRDLHYPPLMALVNVVVRGRSADEAMAAANGLARRLRAHRRAGMTVLGPAPAAMSRLRGEHRVQLLLKGTRRTEMRQALQTVLADYAELRRRITVDVDPLNVL